MSTIALNVTSFVKPHKGDNSVYSDVTSQKLCFPCIHVNKSAFSDLNAVSVLMISQNTDKAVFK